MPAERINVNRVEQTCSIANCLVSGGGSGEEKSADRNIFENVNKTLQTSEAADERALFTLDYEVSSDLHRFTSLIKLSNQDSFVKSIESLPATSIESLTNSTTDFVAAADLVSNRFLKQPTSKSTASSSSSNSSVLSSSSDSSSSDSSSNDLSSSDSSDACLFDERAESGFVMSSLQSSASSPSNLNLRINQPIITINNDQPNDHRHAGSVSKLSGSESTSDNSTDQQQPINRSDDLKPVNKQSWLLRLFESKLFNTQL